MIYLTSPHARFEILRIPVHQYRVGTARVLNVEFVADAATAEGQFACTIANRLYLSLNGGLNYTPVGTDVQTGVSLAAFASGERKEAKIKVQAPDDAAFGTELIGVKIGSGT